MRGPLVALPWFIVSVAVLAVGGCGPTVEQAKQVTTALRTEAFTPPPRNVKDVLARLETPAATRDLEQRRTLAAQAPPANAGAAALALFHLQRGRAAALTGRVDRYLDDVRQANIHLEQATGITRTDARDILRELRAAESQVGRYTAAVEALGRARRLQPTSIVNDTLLADLLVRAGDHAGGIEAATRARTRFATQRSSDDPSAPNTAAVAEALIADAEGRWEEAEAYWRKALDLVTLAFSTPSIRSVELGASEEVTRARLRARVAEALRRQGRVLEAEIFAREALQAMLGVFGASNIETVEVVNVLALAILDQGRAADAELLARAALARLDAMGAPADAPIRAPSRLTLVRSLLPRRQWAHAGRELVALRAGLGDNRALFDRGLALDPDVPLTLLQSGQVDEALALASAGHQALAATQGPTGLETAQMQAVLALALGAKGRVAEALAAFREALPVLLARETQPVGAIPTGQGADWRQPIFIEGYVALLARSAGTAVERQAGIDAAAEAFRVADLARAGAVQRALTANAVRAASRTPELADLVRREQDAHAQSLALLGQVADATLARVADKDADGKPRSADQIKEAAAARIKQIADLKQKVADLTAARRTLRGEIERRFPDYAALVTPRPVPVDEARRALRAGEVLLAFLSGEDRTWVWAVPREGAVSFTAAPLGREQLGALVARLRRGTALAEAATLDDVPVFDVAAAHELYRVLLEPVAAAWQSARTLVVAPHGPLGLVPLSMLATAPPPARPAGGPRFSEYRGIRWLARTHAVTTAPSVASLVAVRRLAAASASRPAFVGFGDPLFSGRPTGAPPADVAARSGALSARRLGARGGPAPGAATPTLTEQLARLEALPDTADELRSIARALGASAERDVFLGREASEVRVKSMDLSRHRVVAFATHALVTGELEGLEEPALALSIPAAGAGDGLLMLGEILALRLDADWIVLSACNTAAGTGTDAEVMAGLGRAAFYAGARALLVSHWAVESVSARLLTTGLFERQRTSPELTRAEALRQSMLALIDGATDPRSGPPTHSLAHPAFWAPFVLVGDGG